MSKTPVPDVIPEASQPAPEAGFVYPAAGGSYIRDPDTGALTRQPDPDQEPIHADFQ